MRWKDRPLVGPDREKDTYQAMRQEETRPRATVMAMAMAVRADDEDEARALGPANKLGST